MSKKSSDSDLEDELYPFERLPEWERFKGERKLFEAVCEDMKEAGREATGRDITDVEASEAARNLIGFCECLMDIERDRLKRERAEAKKVAETPGAPAELPGAES